MSSVHETMGSDEESGDESPIYSDAAEGKDEATRVEEGDQGEQFWIQEP